MKILQAIGMFLLGAAVATPIVAGVVIYSRKRRKARSAAEEARCKAAEEARRKAEEEARHEAEEEARKKAEEETQRKAKEEARRKVEEETRQRAEEEARRKSEEESQKKAEEERRKAEEKEKQRQVEQETGQKTTTGSKRVAPGARGGRPRDTTQDGGGQETQGAKTYCPKPEIICWKKERQWILAVEVPEILRANSNLKVLQNESSLTEDESQEGYWRLEQIDGCVVVRWNEDAPTKIEIGKKGYLLFKLSGNEGRRVKSPSSGSYLVVVPNNWKCDDALETTEPVSVSGYQGYFLVVGNNDNRKIAFHTPKGKSVEIRSESARFELVGNQLNDASERVGPLFGENPPRIRALDRRAWEDVKTIVIGVEGRGRKKWRKDFAPEPDSGEVDQALPSKLANQKGGWFFVRIYDKNDDLVESIDFRFLRDLKDIKTPCSLLPSGGRHKPAIVKFLHEPECAVQPADRLASSDWMKYADGKTVLTIPRDPICDNTRWRVGTERGPKVEVTILVERLWWALGEEHNEPSRWTDKVVTLRRDDFLATSDKTLWVRLPRQRWAREVRIGFEESRARPYPIKVTEKAVAISLRDFEGAPERGKIGKSSLSLWVCPQGTTYEGVVCEVVVKAACKFCDFLASTEEDMLRHVESHHMDKFFQPLTYDEMRKLNPSLPPGIYKCSYCDFYVRSDDVKSPTSTICRHIERECPKVDHSKGPVQIKFRPISNVDEIRENVIKNRRY